MRLGVALCAIAAGSAIAVAAPARTVTGVVVDELSGEPVVSAIVTTSQGSLTTAADGSFAIGVDPDDDLLTVTAAGYSLRSLRVGEYQTLRIVLTPSHELI